MPVPVRAMHASRSCDGRVPARGTAGFSGCREHGPGRVLAILLLLALMVAMPALISTAEAAPRSCAHAARVEQAARSFISAARAGSPAAFRRALQRHLAMRRIALFALGRHGRRLDAAHRRRYLRLTTDYIARQLAARSATFRNAHVRITGCRGNVVEGRILPQGRRIRWRLSRGRIVDVNLDGVWLAVALRDHYRALLRRSNGDVKTFLAMLR